MNIVHSILFKHLKAHYSLYWVSTHSVVFSINDFSPEHPQLYLIKGTFHVHPTGQVSIEDLPAHISLLASSELKPGL